MKIAQVIPFFAPAWSYGGPVRVCYELSSELAKRGHNVTVLTTDAYDHLKRIDKVCEDIGGVKVIRFRNISNRLAKNLNLFLPKYFNKYLKTNIKNFDIVHLHAFYTFQNIIASKYCLKFGVPYVLHLHEKFDPTSEMGKSSVKKLFLFIFGKKLINGATKIIVLSENEKQNLLKYDQSLKDKIEVVPNNAPKYSGPCKNKDKLRQKYKLTNDAKVILSLSRMSPLKGIDLLIRAFAVLAKSDDKYQLIIAGPDERGYKSKLQKIIDETRIEDKVIFTGMADDKMKSELFCVADIFALFSKYESFGMVVLEALSYDLPVCLSKNVGVQTQVYQLGCAKIISSPCSKSQSALELKKAFDSRKSLVKNCKKAVESFSPKRTADRVTSIYKEVSN